MTRRRAKIDVNQPEIVKNLRKLGYSVAVTSSLGKGFPDILVGHNHKNFMFEIKDPNKPPSQVKLTDDELTFHRKWRGQINTVFDAEEIINLIKQGV